MADDDPLYGFSPVESSLLSHPELWTNVEQHAAGLGWAVIAWCQLCEELGLLFAEVSGNGTVALAAWHQVQSDRTQRAMLRAAVESSLDEKPNVRKYLLWALGQIQSMEDGRNNAVHAPVELVLDTAGISFVPMDATGNPRSEKLKDKDLAVEFRRYQRNADVLCSFIRTLRTLARPGVDASQLPPRPQLLSYEQAIAEKRESKAPHV
jgi:hypothetical protein